MQLRIICPAVILAMFLIDAAARLVPPSAISFRSWEAAAAQPNSEGDFQANLIYRSDHSFGDVANLANLPALRVYRTETWSDDAWGYRNSLRPKDQPVRAIVAGDSFAAGDGLREDQTLSSQLFLLTGLRCENAGGVFGAGRGSGWAAMERLGPLIQRLGMKGGVVIYEQSERVGVPEGPEPRLGLPMGLGRRLPVLDALYLRVRHTIGYSPLKIVLERGFKRLEDDYWLPNIYAAEAVQGTLHGGQRLLFLPTEVQNYAHPRPAGADFFLRLQSAVRSTGNELLVVLVPDKYNVYYPLRDDPEPVPADAGAFFRNLSANLHQAGVPVLDFTPIFRKQAADGLASGKYNYFLDDTHWSPVATRLAAQEIVKTAPFVALKYEPQP